MFKIIVGLILLAPTLGYAQFPCYQSPQEALNFLLMRQPQLKIDKNYNYQDSNMRVEKRSKPKEHYQVLLLSNCSVDRDISSIKQKSKDQIFLYALGGFSFFQGNYDSNNYSAKIISKPSPFIQVGGYMIISRRNRIFFNATQTFYQFQDADTKTLNNQDTSTIESNIGLTHHFSKKFYLYSSLGFKEFVLNRAVNLTTLEFYTDVSPTIAVGANYKFYRYKNVELDIDSAANYYFSGMDGHFQRGYGIDGGFRSSYYMKKSKISLGLKIKKKSIKGVYYNSDELESFIFLSLGQKF